jgi:hypothetical protein
METLGGATLTINRGDVDGMIAAARELGSHVAEMKLAGYKRTFDADSAILSMHYTRDGFRDAFLAMGASEVTATANACHLFEILATCLGNAKAKGATYLAFQCVRCNVWFNAAKDYPQENSFCSATCHAAYNEVDDGPDPIAAMEGKWDSGYVYDLTHDDCPY